MDRFKTVCKRLLFIPVWLMILLAVFCTSALVTVFLQDMEETPIAYAVYVLSAYTLSVICVFFVMTLPQWYRSAKKRIYETQLGNKYMTDTAFKVRVSLYISLTVNLLYSAFKLASGIYFSSFWWGAIAVYYIVLSVIRFLLLRYMRGDNKHILSEFRRYRLCGILMMLLNLSLTGIVFQMVWQNKSYSYPEIIVIASAAYTFYTVTVSIVDIIRYRKYNSPVMSASKAIRFAAALVSLLTLETAMLTSYGEDDVFRRIMTAATGAGVCIIVLAMSVYMIVRANRNIKNIKSSKEFNFNGKQ
ncbi:MAG: hypothetical protein IJ391_03000 [Clostridia bacterium]|nr:hypothetical protein [Clostridia bacterium]